MTKQETIRERIDNDIGNLLWRYYYARRNRGEITPQEEYSHRQKYVCGMKDLLARRGVVIKVDRELPDKWRMQWEGDLGVSGILMSDEGEEEYDRAIQDMLEAGYVAVGPLIENITIDREPDCNGSVNGKPLIKEVE